jgi:hypothetical protein
MAASQTEFGKYYNFGDVLDGFRKGDKEFYNRFKKQVPIHTYNKIHAEWWKLALRVRETYAGRDGLNILL